MLCYFFCFINFIFHVRMFSLICVLSDILDDLWPCHLDVCSLCVLSLSTHHVRSRYLVVSEFPSRRKNLLCILLFELFDLVVFTKFPFYSSERQFHMEMKPNIFILLFLLLILINITEFLDENIIIILENNKFNLT